MAERRNDIGNKAIGAVLALLITLIAGASIYQSQANAKSIVAEAKAAKEEINVNRVCIAEIKVTQDYTIEYLKKIDAKL